MLQASLPLLGLRRGELIDTHLGSSRVLGLNPGGEVLGPQFGKGQQEIAHVSLGIDDQRRNVVDRRLFQQTDSQSGFSTAGHSHKDRMCQQVARIVQQWNRQITLLLAIERSSEVENPELFVNGCRPAHSQLLLALTQEHGFRRASVTKVASFGQRTSGARAVG